MANVARPKQNSLIENLVEFYLHSHRFVSLKPKTQKDYEVNLERALATKVKHLNKPLGKISIRHIRLAHIREAYDEWLTIGVRTANYRVACLSAVFSYAIECDLMLYNPTAGLRKKTTKPRRVKWTRDQVHLFLDTAYSDFKWRSIGLIVQMSYAWAQRVGDMRMLTWDALDLDAQRMDLSQSKRGADVHLPIDDNLTAMLRQQKEDFGFQQYVAPKPKPVTGSYVPYPIDQIDDAINEVKLAAGLPKNLTAMDLRRTALTEMAEAGVDAIGMRQVSGHASMASMTPYLVNTLRGATTALNKREELYKDD